MNKRRYRGNSRNGSRRRFHGKGKGRGKRSFSKKIHPSKYVSKGTSEEVAPAFEASITFNDLNILDELKQNIAKKGYTKPTEIQEKAIPEILTGSDIIGIASTGSGKTDSFVIPVANKLISLKREKCLIIAPTRELAMQIEKEFKAMIKGTPVHSTVIIGGANMSRQIRDLKRRPQCVIATPGRLKDHAERGTIRLNEYSTIVLDEVDRMLDMGFVHDIKAIIAKLPKERQTLFFSATMTKDADKIAHSLLNKPKKIQIASVAPHKNIHQDIVKIKDPGQKVDELVKILQTGGYGKTIVFGRTKRGCDKLSRILYKKGFKTDAIHGNKSQNARQRVLKKFKDSNINILVATDVAARGIHVNDVDLVVNYDEPENFDDYIHRIGRTGRAGRTGNALTFIH